MSRKAARNFFVLGRLFFLLLMISTIDVRAQVPEQVSVITPEIDAGKRLAKYDCIGYHTILENGFHLPLDKTTVVS